MNPRSTVLLLCPSVITAIAALLYEAKHHRSSTDTLGVIRDTLKQNVPETRAMQCTLRRQRGAINDIHAYLVPKGSAKASV
jgi:hypothetical protein